MSDVRRYIPHSWREAALQARGTEMSTTTTIVSDGFNSEKLVRRARGNALKKESCFYGVATVEKLIAMISLIKFELITASCCLFLFFEDV